MQPGNLAGGDVQAFTTRVTVYGVEYPVKSWSVKREIAGDLPDQVAHGSGLSRASGTIVWGKLEDVSSKPANPWSGSASWPPPKGARVVVWASDETNASWRKFTGNIDETTGNTDGDLESTVIDDQDQLNVPFSHPALLRYMPPFAEGGEYRGIGLDHWYVATMACRKAGLFNTPAIEPNSALSVPMQGSMWPEAGNLANATATAPYSHARFFASPWGHSTGNATADYLARLSETLATPLQVSFMVAPDHAGVTTFDTYFGAVHVRLRVGNDRNVTAYFNNGTSYTTVRGLTGAQMSGATIVTFLAKNGVWYLRNNAGVNVSASYNTTAHTSPMSLIRVSADNASRIAGLQVSHPNSVEREFVSNAHLASMMFVPGALGASMDASPAIRGRKVADLLHEISSATLTAMWFDESGVFRMVPSDKLIGATPSQTITTLDDIRSLGWSDSFLSLRHTVGVDWMMPAISKGKVDNQTIYEGRAETLESGQVSEEFISPPSGEDWIQVDGTVSQDIYGGASTFNRGRGSYAGGVVIDPEVVAVQSDLAVSMSLVAVDTYKLTQTASTLPAGKTLVMRTSEDSVSLWPARRGNNLPMIRARGKVVWEKATVESAASLIPGTPYLSHDLSYWGGAFDGGGSIAQRIADFIAAYVTNPAPTINSVRVGYDPRRQVGDVYTLNSGLLDISLNVLVTGIDSGFDGGFPHQTLDLRVVSGGSTKGVTYADLEAAWEGSNYSALEAVWAGATYDQFKLDPLEGAPNA